MKIRLDIFATIAVAGVLLVSGCLSSASSFVTSSIPVAQDRYTVLASEVSDTCTQVQWLFFTFGPAGSPQRHALEGAINQVIGADAIVAMAVDVEQFAFFSPTLSPFAILPVFTTTRVTGTPVKLNVQ